MGRRGFSLLLLGALALFQYKNTAYQDLLPAACQFVSKPCPNPPAMPYPRTDHSAIIYKTWSQADANMLCNNIHCGPLCTKISTNCTSEIKRAGLAPEGETSPIGSVKDSFCPETCCATENCRRVRDALGEVVPFDDEVMLVFGGRAFRNVSLYGVKLLNNCTSKFHIEENRARALEQGASSAYVNSCGMELQNELWRYSVQGDSWTYLKPTINRMLASNYSAPAPRYAHTSVLVEVSGLDRATRQPVTRKYMYIYGGSALECESGCTDFWRYEIPWAAQRYYPQPSGSLYWNRGNSWERISLVHNPGPRMHHGMTVSADSKFIYVFGGISNNTLLNDLWRYSLEANLWEKLETEGVEAVHRSAQLWNGTLLELKVPFEQFSTNDSFSFSTQGDKPSPRLGASLFYFQTTEDFLVLYGGYGQRTINAAEAANIPESKGDMWVYSVKLRRWCRVVPRGNAPPPRYFSPLLQYEKLHFALFSGASLQNFREDLWIYSVAANAYEEESAALKGFGEYPRPRRGHTMLLTAEGVLIYGGAIGTNTNISFSDTDYQTLQVFESQCESFLRTYNLSVRDLGQPKLWKKQLELYEKTNNTCFLWNKTFATPVGTDDAEAGVWVYNFSTCFQDCNGNGTCVYSACACNDGFYGGTCGETECPNSVCVSYTDFTYTKYCYHCSGKGTCVSGQCICKPGYRGADCSIQDCPSSCSSVGKCVSDYPYAKCGCPSNTVGDDCSQFACTNSCNSPHGACNGTTGVCTCQPYYYGSDCSLFVLPSTAVAVALGLLGLV